MNIAAERHVEPCSEEGRSNEGNDRGHNKGIEGVRRSVGDGWANIRNYGNCNVNLSKSDLRPEKEEGERNVDAYRINQQRRVYVTMLEDGLAVWHVGKWISEEVKKDYCCCTRRRIVI